MDKIVGLIADLSDTRTGGGDSFCDRLNCRYTVYVCVVLALGITTKTFFGDTPIACWCPAHFTDSHVEFTNKVRLKYGTLKMDTVLARINPG